MKSVRRSIREIIISLGVLKTQNFVILAKLICGFSTFSFFLPKEMKSTSQSWFSGNRWLLQYLSEQWLHLKPKIPIFLRQVWQFFFSGLIFEIASEFILLGDFPRTSSEHANYGLVCSSKESSSLKCVTRSSMVISLSEDFRSKGSPWPKHLLHILQSALSESAVLQTRHWISLRPISLSLLSIG